MITEIATVDLLNTAIDKIDDGKIADAKDDLITFRDKIQNEIDQFENGLRYNLILILQYN